MFTQGFQGGFFQFDPPLIYAHPQLFLNSIGNILISDRAKKTPPPSPARAVITTVCPESLSARARASSSARASLDACTLRCRCTSFKLPAVASLANRRGNK